MSTGDGHSAPVQIVIKDVEAFRRQLLNDIRQEVIAGLLCEDYILTENEAANLLQISKRTLLRMRNAGEVHCGFLAGKPRYSLGQIRRLMRETVRQD